MVDDPDVKPELRELGGSSETRFIASIFRDRILHHATINNTKGDRYRLRGK